MQLLERHDKLKWYVWIAQGRKQEDDNPEDDDYDTSEFSKSFDEFFNKSDAV